eukprot:11859009-Prorocentrum_lima.AAC.1
MTSSLVGSEMCIRDRCMMLAKLRVTRTARLPPARAPTRHGGGIYSSGHHVARLALRPCWLLVVQS